MKVLDAKAEEVQEFLRSEYVKSRERYRFKVPKPKKHLFLDNVFLDEYKYKGYKFEVEDEKLRKYSKIYEATINTLYGKEIVRDLLYKVISDLYRKKTFGKRVYDYLELEVAYIPFGPRKRYYVLKYTKPPPSALFNIISNENLYKLEEGIKRVFPYIREKEKRIDTYKGMCYDLFDIIGLLCYERKPVKIENFQDLLDYFDKNLKISMSGKIVFFTKIFQNLVSKIANYPILKIFDGVSKEEFYEIIRDYLKALKNPYYALLDQLKANYDHIIEAVEDKVLRLQLGKLNYVYSSII